MTQPDYSQLSIVLPAYNEEAGIGPTLDNVKAAFPGAEVIVVNDCSRDNTSQVVETSYPWVRLVQHPFNRGQGAALKTGMQAATRLYVAWFDADNEHRTEDLAKLYARITDDRLVAVIGQRTSASANYVRASGKALIRLIGRGLQIKVGADLNCGLRVFRREIILRYLPLIPDRFSASMLTTLIMLERSYPIGFEPVTTNPRIGTSTVRLKDGFEAIMQLLRAVMLFSPMRLFLPMGLAFLLLGGLYSVIVMFLRHNGIPVAGGLMILTGMLCIMLGLIADQISQLRLTQIPALNFADKDQPHEPRT